MTGRPERRTWALALAGPVLLLVGCGEADEAGSATEVTEVAVCADLRARENELIRVANEALSELARAEDDGARAGALAGGYDRLLDTLTAQDPVEVAAAPGLAQRLRAGQRAAIAALEDERDRFVAEVPAVTQSDEQGRAGELQNALEKVFSELEPPRSAYVVAGLDGAIDADPACRHVTQRRDPAG